MTIREAAISGDLETSTLVHSEPDAIFALAAHVEEWPRLLPHYRRVSVVMNDGRGLKANMFARRGWIPVRWQAVVRTDSTLPAIFFTHTGGFTKGMEVEWRFERQENGTRVTILHRVSDIPSGWRRWAIRWLVGRLFVDPIARRTLRTFKHMAEPA